MSLFSRTTTARSSLLLSAGRDSARGPRSLGQAPAPGGPAVGQHEAARQRRASEVVQDLTDGRAELAGVALRAEGPHGRGGGAPALGVGARRHVGEAGGPARAVVD